MLYPSPIRIVTQAGLPGERVLLEYDQLIGAIPAMPTDQVVAVSELIGQQWAGLDAMGNGQRALDVETEALMTDAAAAAVAALDAEAEVEPQVKGLRIELANPMLGPGYSAATRTLVRWDCSEATLASCRISLDGNIVRHALSMTIGNAIAEIIEHPAATIPVGLCQVLSDGTHDHDGQRWYRVKCVMPDDFEGNATDGWTNGTLRLDLEWSGDDLATWTTGQCVAAPVADVVADGTRTAWAESARPQNCGALTSDMTLRWAQPAGAVTWTLEQDVEWLQVSGSNISLPNFPYAMPGDAATLQTDLRANGFPGAEVEVDSGSAWWEIRLFDAETSDYHHVPGGYCNPGYEYTTRDGTLWNNTLRGSYSNPRFGPELDPFGIYMRQFIRGRVSKI